MRLHKSVCWIWLTLAWLLRAGQSDEVKYLKDKAEAYFPEAVQIRRQLHQMPELCFQEKKTSAFILDYLKKLNLEVTSGIARYGIKAVLKGSRPTPVIGIRTDMDALPLAEASGLPFQATSGTMHACGHDVHMANVLIAARLLSEIREQIPGTVVFIFQPCEEGNSGGQPGGAEQMIREGVMENPHLDALIALHLMPHLPVGCVALRPGPIMADSASVHIKILGKASHGALPHQGVDAIHAAAQAIVQFQSLISRLKDPSEKAVLSIGTIRGGVRLNVIAEEVEMEGTVRSFSLATQQLIETGMERILKGLELVYGIRYEFNFFKGNPHVQNSEALVNLLMPVFKRVAGEENVITAEPMTISEDFALFSQRLPSLFFFLGTGEDTDLHSPQFKVDERLLKTAPALFAAAALAFLQQGDLR